VDAAGVSDAGKVDDLIDAVEQRPPVDRFRQIRVLHDLDAGAKRRSRTPHGGAHVMADVRQRPDGGAADKARGSGDQDVAHRQPRAKAPSSQPTRTAPAASAAKALIRPGTITVNVANTPRPTLTANTRATTPMVEKPLSVAR